MKILVEGKFGHGGRVQRFHILRTKIRRALRPKLGKSAIPFNWEQGVDNTKLVTTIKNQFEADSCGGEAGAYLLGILNALRTGTYTEISAKSIYSPIFYPGGGTTIPALENQITQKGANLESDVPSYFNGTTSEQFMEDRSWMTPAMLQKALENAGYIAVSVSLDMDSIANAIAQYGAVIWEITGQNNGTWLSQNPQPPMSKVGLWNHFMCLGKAFLQNNGAQTLGALQSWGNTIGDNGKQYFAENYVKSGYIIDCFTFVKKPSPTKFIFNNDLQYGSTLSPDVKQLQTRLGVWQSGYFGPLTYAAVRLYQYWHGIPETGYVGPMTRSALNTS